MSKIVARGLLSYTLIALALWPWPLLRILHVESSAIVACASFFVAGLCELPHLARPSDVPRALLRQLLLLTVPLALLTVTMLWAPNCAYLTGLSYFLLFALPSAVLGVGVAFLVHQLQVRAPRGAFVASGLSIVVAGVIYDIGFHPQFYTYNHVFGGVMGPIYDEEFAFRWALIPFRVLTLSLAALCFLIGREIGRRRQASAISSGFTRVRRSTFLAVLLLIVSIYALSAPLGINSPEWYLRQSLGEEHQSDRLSIYFDPVDPRVGRVEEIAAQLSYHRSLLENLFDYRLRDRYHVYLYPDAFTRERLTGARFTNVSPVWLRRPQMHVLSSESGRVLTHELVHIFARDFGLPLIGASPAVGLVEGLAVALEAPTGGPSVHDQVSAALHGRTDIDREARVDAIAARMSPLGFWGGRGAVSYTSAGSFILYLLEEHGAAAVRAVYRSGRFEDVFHRPTEVLAADWIQYVERRRIVSAAAGPTARRRFSVPSLFERRCPHYVPPPRRHYLGALRTLAAGDTLRAIRQAERSWSMDSTMVASANLAAGLAMARREYRQVIGLREIHPDTDAGPAFDLRLGDALWLEGREADAKGLWQDALTRVAPSSHEFRAMVRLRLRLAADAAGPDLLLRDSSRAPSHDPASFVDSLAVAMNDLRQSRPNDAIRMLRGFIGRDGVTLDEEESLFHVLALSIGEAAHRSVRDYGEAARIARLRIDACHVSGDMDCARAARYRFGMYTWLTMPER